MTNMQRDAFDPVARAQEAQDRQFRDEQRRARTELLMEELMSTPSGREIVSCILDLTGVHAPTFDTNALAMAYREGRRGVGLELMSMLDAESYQLLLKERNVRRRNERRGN